MGNENVKVDSLGNNEFTKKMYNELAKTSSENLFFSPICTYITLCLLHQGAKKETEEALENALMLLSDKLKNSEEFESLLCALNSSSKVTLDVANRIYIADRFKLKESFEEIASKKFSAGIENINFLENRNAAEKINVWVEKKTKNKIKNMFTADALDSNTMMILVNAIYFKADWKKKFEKNSVNGTFFVSESKEIICDMMRLTEKFMYKEEDELNARILKIPYKNENFNLIFVLPNERFGIFYLENKLINYDLNKITVCMFKIKVILSLPKFKIKTGVVDFTEALDNMGLGQIFKKSANFNGIIDNNENLYINKVIQKAFFEVNEEGSVATASCGGCSVKSIKKSVPKEIYYAINHPCIFFLQFNDSQKNTHVLFAGRLNEPKF